MDYNHSLLKHLNMNNPFRPPNYEPAIREIPPINEKMFDEEALITELQVQSGDLDQMGRAIEVALDLRKRLHESIAETLNPLIRGNPLQLNRNSGFLVRRVPVDTKPVSVMMVENKELTDMRGFLSHFAEMNDPKFKRHVDATTEIGCNGIFGNPDSIKYTHWLPLQCDDRDFPEIINLVLSPDCLAKAVQVCSVAQSAYLWGIEDYPSRVVRPTGWEWLNPQSLIDYYKKLGLRERAHTILREKQPNALPLESR